MKKKKLIFLTIIFITIIINTFINRKLICFELNQNKPVVSDTTIAPLLTKAYANHKQSKNRKAMQQILTYLLFFPGSYKGHELAARLYELKGERQKAILHWLEMLKQDHPLNYLYIKKISASIIEKTSRTKVIAAFLKLLIKTEYAPVKIRLQYSLGHLYRAEGMVKKSQYYFKRIQWIRPWRILGPFDNDRNSGFHFAYPPEKKVSYKKGYKGKRGQVYFREPPFLDYDGFLNLKPFFYPKKGVLAYGISFVYSPHKQDYYVYAGASDGIKLWINDRLVLSYREKMNLSIDQFRVKISLNKGWNKILFKSPQESGQWQLAIRVSDLSHKPVPYRRFTNHLKPYQSDKRKSSASIRKKDDSVINRPMFLNQYLNTIAEDEKLYYLGLLYSQNNFREKEIAVFEELLKNRPNSSFLLSKLGRAYHRHQEWGKGLSAFKQAIQLDNSNFQAHLGLGQYYYNKSRYDKSLEKFVYLRKNFAKNIHTLIYLIKLYRKKKWFYDALLTAKNLKKLFPRYYLSYIYLGDCLQTFQQWRNSLRQYQKSIHFKFSNSLARNKTYQLAKQKGQFNKLTSTLKELILLYPSSLQYRLQLGEFYLNQKQYSKALSIYSGIRKISPHHPEIHKKLGDIFYRLKKHKKSLQHYRLSLKYKPENHQLREYVNFLSPKQYFFLKQYDLSDSQADKIKTSAPKIGAYPKSKGVILLKRKLIEVFQNGSSYYQYHYIIQVSNQAGIKEFNQITVPKKMEKLIKAVTINPDGQEYEATVFDKGKISFPSLKIGSIIEYKYIIERDKSGWLEDHYYSYFFFQNSHPILKSELILSIPKNKQIKIFTNSPDIKQKKYISGNNSVYHWLSKNNSQIHDEVFRPPFYDVSKKVMLTTIASWQKYAQWQNSLINDQFEIDSAIRKKVRQLTGDEKSLIDKIKAIFYFTANEIYYLNNDVGIYGKLPNRCTLVFANKFGDCKDKSTLLIAMLKEIDITAYYAGIRTNTKGTLIPDIPASQTNHIITYIPKQKGIAKGFFVDPTSELFHFDYIRTNDQGVWAIILKLKEFELKKTPIYPAKKNILKDDYEISVKNKTDLDVKVLRTASGNYARKIRVKYKLKKKRKELLEKIFNKKFQGIHSLAARFSILEQPETPINIAISFAVKQFLKIMDNKLYLQAFHLLNLSSTFAPKEERVHDLEFRYGLKRIIVEKINIPANYKLSHQPKNFSFEFKNLVSFSIKYHLKQNQLIRTKEFILEKGKIPAADYSQFRELCIKGDRADKTTLIFRKTN